MRCLWDVSVLDGDVVLRELFWDVYKLIIHTSVGKVVR